LVERIFVQQIGGIGFLIDGWACYVLKIFFVKKFLVLPFFKKVTKIFGEN